MGDPAPPKRQFIIPRKFRGTGDEDASEWMELYESIGQHNRWGAVDLAANFGMYLDSSARQWFRCTTLPAEWNDTVEVIGVPAQGLVPEVRPVAAATGLKTRFLLEFVQEKYSLFQESKLRNRMQGPDEPTSNYYYDVIHLCRSVNPQMTELNRLEYLYRGLVPWLVEKIYPLNPQTCAEFWTQVKIHTEAATIARNKSSNTANLYTQQAIPVAVLAQEATNDERDRENLAIYEQMKVLQQSIFEYKLRCEEEDDDF